jgi:hypothetical protein
LGESFASTAEDLVAKKPQLLLQHSGSAAKERDFILKADNQLLKPLDIRGQDVSAK